MLEDCHEYLAAIDKNLREAFQHLDSLFLATAKLEMAGCYSGVPTEEWESQNDGGEGLTLHFPSKPDGTYSGPGGQQTVHVGTDPKQIAEAQRLAENRRRREKLWAAAQDLDTWLLRYEEQLRFQAGIAKYWPRFEISDPLPGEGPPEQNLEQIPVFRGT